MNMQKTEPHYQTNVDALADELRTAHGGDAMDVAVQTARAHFKTAAWKHFAVWLQVVNRLNRSTLTHPNPA